MRPPLLAAGLVLGVIAAGCSSPSRTTEPPALVPAASPPAPPPLTFTLAGDAFDGGMAWEAPLQTGTRTSIEPAATLSLRASAPLRNYRVRVFDEVDRALESDDSEVRSDAQGLEYRIQLKAPLLAGHRYTLLVDPQTPGPLLEPSGRTHDEQRFDLQTTGERAKAPPPAKSSGKKRRRR